MTNSFVTNVVMIELLTSAQATQLVDYTYLDSWQSNLGELK